MKEVVDGIQDVFHKDVQETRSKFLLALFLGQRHVVVLVPFTDLFDLAMIRLHRIIEKGIVFLLFSG
jgi:hypothetical protein